MNVALAFILPLIGGYLFCTIWGATRYEMAREDGHRLYFRSAFWGAYVFVVALLLRTIAFSLWPTFDKIESWLVALVSPVMSDPGKSLQEQIALTAGYSLLVGPVLGLLIDLVTPLQPALDRALASEDFDKLLFYCMERGLPVYLTLDTGKVYVGYALETPAPSTTRKAITILPLLSGYRDQNQKVTLSVNYAPHYLTDSGAAAASDTATEGPIADDFRLVIFVSRIVSASPFTLSAYERFQEAEKPLFGAGHEGQTLKDDSALADG